MEDTVVKKVERVLNTLDEVVSKQNNLKEADRLNELYKEIEPDPFHYSIERAMGLPTKSKRGS